MPDTDIWPPKPDLPDPLTEYDAVIAAKIAAMPIADPGQMRFRLIKDLREEGLELRQAMVLVRSYGDRHGAFVPSKGYPFFAWSNFILSLAMLVLICFNLYLSRQRDAMLHLPHHHAASLVLLREELSIDYFVVVFALLNLVAIIIRFRKKRKK